MSTFEHREAFEIMAMELEEGDKFVDLSPCDGIPLSYLFFITRKMNKIVHYYIYDIHYNSVQFGDAIVNMKDNRVNPLIVMEYKGIESIKIFNEVSLGGIYLDFSYLYENVFELIYACLFRIRIGGYLILYTSKTREEGVIENILAAIKSCGYETLAYLNTDIENSELLMIRR